MPPTEWGAPIVVGAVFILTGITLLIAGQLKKRKGQAGPYTSTRITASAEARNFRAYEAQDPDRPDPAGRRARQIMDHRRSPRSAASKSAHRHTAQLRPVEIPVQIFKVWDQCDSLIGSTAAVTPEEALRRAVASFGVDIYLTRVEPAPHREMHPAATAELRAGRRAATHRSRART